MYISIPQALYEVDNYILDTYNTNCSLTYFQESTVAIMTVVDSLLITCFSTSSIQGKPKLKGELKISLVFYYNYSETS